MWRENSEPQKMFDTSLLWINGDIDENIDVQQKYNYILVVFCGRSRGAVRGR